MKTDYNDYGKYLLQFSQLKKLEKIGVSNAAYILIPRNPENKAIIVDEIGNELKELTFADAYKL